MGFLGFPLELSQVNPQTAGLFAVFAIGLFFLYKTMKFMMTAVMVAVASALFPFIANYLGMKVSTSVESIATFVVWGVALFVVSTLIKDVLKILKLVTLPLRKLLGK